jgi:hypothetical protein
MSNHVFFPDQHPLLLNWNWAHSRGDLERKHKLRAWKADKCWMLRGDVEAIKNYQYSWTRTWVVIRWWLKALLPLFMIEKGEAVPLQCLWPLLVECWGEKLIFLVRGTCTNSVSNKRLCGRSLFILETQHLFNQTCESSYSPLMPPTGLFLHFLSFTV